MNRRLPSLLLVALIAALAALPGCQGEEPVNNPRLAARYFHDAPPGWRVEVWVNGQPAGVTDGSDQSRRADITHFVVHGDNVVRIVADRIADAATTRPADAPVAPAPPRPFKFELTRATGPKPENFEHVGQVDEPRPAGDHIERELKFQAVVPLRWTWQAADDVGELTEADRQAIVGWIAELADALQAKDAAKVKARVEATPNFWPELVPLMPGQERPWPKTDINKMLDYLFAFTDYTVTAAPADEVQLLAGSKVVRVAAGGGRPLLNAGHGPDWHPPEGQENPAWKADSLLFIRVHDGWQPMLSTP